MVAALVCAAALGAGQRPQQSGLSGGQGGAKVKRMGQVGVALGGGPDIHVAGQPAQLGQPLQAVPKSGLVTDYPAGLPHGVAERPLQGASELAPMADETGQLLVGGSDDVAGPQGHITGGRVAGGGLPGPAAEDDRLGQRVSAQPVGAM